MQSFVILMITLVIIGTLVDIIHKKNVKYFFENAKKAKKSAKKTLSTKKKTSVVIKTVAQDILTTSELGAGKRKSCTSFRNVWNNIFLVGFCNYDFLFFIIKC